MLELESAFRLAEDEVDTRPEVPVDDSSIGGEPGVPVAGIVPDQVVDLGDSRFLPLAGGLALEPGKLQPESLPVGGAPG